MYKKSFLYSVGLITAILFANPLTAGDSGGDIKPDATGVPTDRSGAGTRHSSIYESFVESSPQKRDSVAKSSANSRSMSNLNENDSDKELFLTVLAPNRTGHTLSEQPRLYWYISKVIQTPIEVTIKYANSYGRENADPLLKVSVQVFKEGVQVLDLSQYDIKLKMDAEYEWSIAFPKEMNKSFKEFSSVGVIKRIAQSSDFIEKINTVEEKEVPIIYAQAGMWYDAISLLLNLIAKYPEDDNLQQQQMSLLKEVGLMDILKN